MKTAGIDISIVIVNYNVKDFLLQCLRSIEKAQSNLNVETIVVDNNSSDGSVGFLKQQFPNVIFHKLDENKGFSFANNLGISFARGKYVLILNPDTILSEDTLSTMHNYMESHTEVGISGCKLLNPDGSFQLACRRGFPTPWVSFCKLFGLQKLFPKSKIFAGYNQTYKSTDETYYVDSIMGAFMFARTEILKEIGGFDTDFFMYGEDIDLCYRIAKKGWKVAYIHSTSVVHYKGESTKRSPINEVKYFYESMKIYSKKHNNNSSIFLFFLKIGIFIRSLFAYLNRFKRQILILFFDIIAINFSLVLGTKLRFEEYLGFPDYAYPIVFIVVSLVMIISMFVVGEYFESKQSVRKALFGYMVSFFFLSSLTYFFKDFAFSRGVLLMTIGFSILISSFVRLLISIYDRIKGRQSDKRIAIIGNYYESEKIIQMLQNADSWNANIIGIISTKNYNDTESKIPYIGNIEYLEKTITDYKLQEIIITDTSIASNNLFALISEYSDYKVRFHVAQDYDDFIAARIINEISGIEPTVPKYNITKFRYRLLKRCVDILISLIFLTIGLPISFIINLKTSGFFKDIFNVLKGRISFIGIYPDDSIQSKHYRVGLIGMAHISKPERLSTQAISNLNNFYLQHFSLMLDFDIFIKYLFRKNRG